MLANKEKMANGNFLDGHIDEASANDRKSLGSKTRFTERTTISSADSLNDKKRFESSKVNKGKALAAYSHDIKCDSSYESENESLLTDNSNSVNNLISSLRRSKFDSSRSKSVPRLGRISSRYDDSPKYGRESRRTRVPEVSPRSSRRQSHSRTPRSSRLDNDHLKSEHSSSSRHRLRQMIAREEMDLEDEHHAPRQKSRVSNIDRIKSRSRSRLREMITREEELSSALLKNNLRDMMDDELSRSRNDEYKYGLYAHKKDHQRDFAGKGWKRKEKILDNMTHENDEMGYNDKYKHDLYARKKDHQRDFAGKGYEQKVKLSDLTHENEDLKEINLKMRKDMDEMKIQMGEVIETSMFFSVNEDGGTSTESEGMKKLAKAYSTVKKQNKIFENESDELKKKVKELQLDIRRHEETISRFQVQEEEQDAELQDKNELLEALEKDRETQDRYLLESQIENKIIKKRTSILEKKINHLEHNKMRYGHHSKKKVSAKTSDLLYVHPQNDENTISSLED